MFGDSEALVASRNFLFLTTSMLGDPGLVKGGDGLNKRKVEEIEKQ